MTSPRGAVDPAAIVGTYLEAFATGDPDIIAASVSEDFINEHTSALGRGSVGRTAYRTRLGSFLEEMAELRYATETLVVEDQQVAAFYTMTARWQGKIPISIRGVQRLTVEDGRISHRVDYWDSASFLMQVDPEARRALIGFGCG